MTFQSQCGLSAALMAAMRSGLLTALSRGPKTAEAFALELALDVRATRLILDVLAAFDLATYRKGRFSLSEQLSDQIGSTQFELDFYTPVWSFAPDFLASGKPYVNMDAVRGGREAYYVNVVEHIGRLAYPASREIAELLDDKHAPQDVLDVGCGSGVWSLSIAERFARTKVTGLDFPSVLVNFEERAKEMGLSARTATLAGDLHVVTVPEETFDMIIIANLLRLEDSDSAASIVKRASEALRAGGQLLIIDAFSDGTPSGEQTLALYALQLAMRNLVGRVYLRNEFKTWINAAGLEPVTDISLPSSLGPYGAIIATKKR